MKAFVTIAVFAFLAGNVPSCAAETSSNADRQWNQWTGEYFYGTDINVCAQLTLLDDGRFTGWSSGCYGPYGKVFGTWAASGDLLEFRVTSLEGEYVVDLNAAHIEVGDDEVLLVPLDLRIEHSNKGPHSYSCFRRGDYFSWTSTE